MTNELAMLTGLLLRIYPGGVPEAIAPRWEKAALGDEQAYEIVSTPTGTLIRAENETAAGYGGAHLLHALGYRRFAPHPLWEFVPTDPPKSLALKAKGSPDWRMRTFWAGYGQWPEFRKLPDWSEWIFANLLGGEALNTGHAYGGFIRARKAFLAEHPECLALVKGERKGSKLCISNPLLRKEWCDYCCEILEKNPGCRSVSSDPSDGGGWCECAECAKLGSASDRAITLANETARTLRERFPGRKARVALYAYNHHCVPPSVAVDRDVIVNVATAFHREGWTTERLMDVWGKKCAIGVREYLYPDIRPAIGKGANPKLIAKSFRDFYDRGARYMSANASDAWMTGLVGFNVIAACLWDRTSDPEAIRDEIIARGYPNAGKEMREFLSYLDAATPRELSEDLLARMYKVLDAAWRKTTGCERRRVEQAIGYARFCELALDYAKDSSDAKCQAVLDHLAAIKPDRLLHTYAIFRDGRSLGPQGPKLSKTTDWKTPRTLDYAKILEDGLKNNKPMPFEPVSFGRDFVAVRLDPEHPRKGALGGVRGRYDFWLWSDGKPFDLTVTAGLIYACRGNPRLKLVQIGGESETGEEETAVFTDESVPPDKKPHVVKVVPKHAGLHRLEVTDGADRTLYQFPTDMAVAVLEGDGKGRPLEGTFFFYVPKGTKKIGCYASCRTGTVHSPSGRKAMPLRWARGHYEIDVQPGEDGGVWELRGLSGTFRPLTVPDALNLSETDMLIPRAVSGRLGD